MSSSQHPVNDDKDPAEREHIERGREAAKALRLKLRPVPPARGAKPKAAR